MEQFVKAIQENMLKMAATGKLFRANKLVLTKGLSSSDALWDKYINSFLPEDNPVFRDPSSSSKNCNLCKNFIRRYGNIVAIDENYQMITLFDNINVPGYERTAQIMSDYIKSLDITDVFVETFNELNSLPYESCKKTNTHFLLGIPVNYKKYNKAEAEKYGVVKENEIRKFHHFNVTIPAQFVDKTGASHGTIMSKFSSDADVFYRCMKEIPLDTLMLVRDLINQGSLLDGATHLEKVETYIELKTQYDALAANQRFNWCWFKSYNFPLAKFKNELIGVLCTELAEGKEINEACKSWNYRVDPVNYMKATAPITKLQIEQAKKFVEENGYVESFNRRYATLEDIKVTEILHVNAGDGKLKEVSIFDSVKSTSTRHKRSEFDKVEEVTIEKFMETILPTCTSVELFLESRLEKNMVTLTKSKDENSKPMFKWDNDYSWTYNGNIAGVSLIKEAVKAAGGSVTGVLRFSIMWSGDDIDNSDIDAHCDIDKQRSAIYYGCKLDAHTMGVLDVDVTQPLTQMPKGAVENITFPHLNKIKGRKFRFWVHPFSLRNFKGFKAEIEFDGQKFNYESKTCCAVAEVSVDKDGNFSVEHMLNPTESLGVTKDIYSLESNNFHKVNLVCLSPNHWDKNSVGNKHYFFMLDGCKVPMDIRSFHNENLLPELAAHRKVLEVLGATQMIKSSNDKQLSGVGFNATIKDSVILRLQGSHKRVIKVNF